MIRNKKKTTAQFVKTKLRKGDFMLDSQFENFLLDDEKIESKKKAVSSRMSKARAVENELGKSLDVIVQDDMSMYKALITIKNRMNDGSGAYSNSLRKYYVFKNGREFPRILEFEKLHGL